MSVSLVHALIQVCLLQQDQQPRAEVRSTLATASEQAWEQSYITLYWHRLIPLVGYALQRWELLEAVPLPYQTWLQDSYRESLAGNTVRLLTLAGILKKLLDRGIQPVLWKGVVLADQFYPDPGMRMMGDIDFAIAPHELPEFTTVLKSLDFCPKPEKTTLDAFYFENAMGILCDVHHQVKLFDGRETVPLDWEIVPQRLQAPTMRVLTPNAMVAHLIDHLEAHRAHSGPILLWMLDLAFVLRKWGDRLDPTQIQALLPDRSTWLALLRILRLLEKEWGEPLPDRFSKDLKTVHPHCLEEILRERRLSQWGLPYPKGWLRLGASRLSMIPPRKFPYPEVSDLLLWPRDWMVRIVG